SLDLEKDLAQILAAWMSFAEQPAKAALPDSRYVLDFNDPITMDSDNWARVPAIGKIRDLLDYNKPADNRMIVVFAPLEGDSGFTVRSATWLPWALVDPTFTRKGESPTCNKATALHEIGHGCRLAHVAIGVMSTGTCDEDTLFGAQLWEIYRSYWCTGPRPTE